MKLCALLIGSLLFMGVCLASAMGWPSEASDSDVVLGLVGTVFFGLCTIIVVIRIARMRAAVIVISPEGIWDQRVTEQPVSWRNVTEITVWTYLTGTFVQLALDIDTEKRLMKSLLARSLRLANKALGFSGLAISATGTEIDTDTLAALCDVYWKAYRGF